jgi:hypothetical protein
MPFHDTRPQWRTVLASASRTATNSSPEIHNPGAYRGVRLFIDITAVSGSSSVVFSVHVKDPVGGDWSATLLSSAAQTATVTAPVMLLIYPGATAAANAAVSVPIGRSFRVTATHGTADATTYSVSAEWIP